MKTIFEYLDYRQFLADYYREKKHENRYLLWYMGYHFNLNVDHLRKIVRGNSYLAESALP